MTLAKFASLTLARFDDIRDLGEINNLNLEGTFFCNVGADFRSAGSTVNSLRGMKFLLFGLHDSVEAAKDMVQDRQKIATWFDDAVEIWSGVLQPFRHFGSANWLQVEDPGAVYECSIPAPAEEQPILIMTSVGWQINKDTDWERIKRFSDNVAAVRIGMTAIQGLHSQQTFSFAGGLEWDGVTVTMWQNLAAAMSFAYGPGFHRLKVKNERESPDGDRTSFTRFLVLHSEGTWHGTNLWASGFEPASD